MKILFATATFITGKGGVASYAHDFVKAFDSNNEILIVSGEGFNEKFPHKIIKIKHKDFSVQNAKLLLDAIQQFNPDLIVNSNFPLLCLITPYLNEGVKVISISHFVDGYLMWAAGFNGMFCDSIISLSKQGKKNIEKLFHISDPTKVEIVYNFMSSLDITNVASKKETDVVKIVFPGGCSFDKSADVVCWAIKKLLLTDLSFELYWLGNTRIPGDKWPLSKTKRIEDCINTSDYRIKHIGSVTRDDAKQILANANIFLLPSRGEGCPITLLEAMRAGCIPVISDAKHGSYDIVADGKLGFIEEQGDVEALVARLSDIIKNHSSYTYLYDRTIEKFNDDLKSEIWFDKMTEILKRPNSHKRRCGFNIIRYLGDVMIYKLLLIWAWIYDRFYRQLYHFIIFRVIRYFIK